jgi:hypothetical protein
MRTRTDITGEPLRGGCWRRMLGLLSLAPRNDRYQTQARRSHVTPAISGLGSAKEDGPHDA